MRFVLCGAVDDGKSTLIGRILHDSGQAFVDHLRQLDADSHARGGPRGAPDLALLMDGLEDERAQRITIDVAYRGFQTPRRRFLVADAPGHEQYTRNMATGASTADLALVVVDARKGIRPQTARHTRIATTFGLRHLILAVNKMDRVAWDRDVFEAIATTFRTLAEGLGILDTRAVPVSALTGDNVTRDCSQTPWYAGPTLLESLETADVEPSPERQSFRMPVQYVNRFGADFRGYCGRVASGIVRPGQRVRIAPAGTDAEVASIVAWRGFCREAGRGDSITLTLEPDVDVSRGDVIVAADEPLPVSDQFRANLVWMHDAPLVVGRSYRLKLHAREVGATVTRIRHRSDVNDGKALAAARLQRDDLGVVHLATARPVPFTPFDENRELGGFILMDRTTNATVAAGTIAFPLRRAANLRWQEFDVTEGIRAEMKDQRPRCLWLTGLPASGKSTVANLLERRLATEGRHTYLLDGDNVRHGLSRDLGFTEADRAENIRRVAEVARLMVDAGLIVIVSFIAPFRAERDFARRLFEPGDFLEIFVDAPLEVCARRDPKGLYAKAARREIRNLTGVDSPYEAPAQPELRLDTEQLTPDECVERILRRLD